MPALEGKTLNFALYILERSHLKLGDTTFKPDFMKGSVLEQYYKGERIKSGDKLPWGSRVDLVVGKGLDGQPIPVPSLLGMTYLEARSLLDSNGIGITVIADPDVSDTAAAFIYRQSPPRYNESHEQVFMQSGQIMDIWLSRERKSETDSIAP
jgi:beta-lactam-binding protein with PASTA domain